MKKFIYLLILVIGFSGCSVDSLDSEDQINSYDAKGDNGKPSADEISLEFSPNEACAGESVNYCLTFPQATNGGGNKSTNVLVDLKVEGDDPETSDEIENSYYVDIFRGQGDTYVCFDYTIEEEGVYEIRYKTAGNNGVEWISDQIVVEDCSNCDNLLVAELTCGDTSILEVSFVAEESGPIVIQGGLTSGTSIIDAQSEALEQNLTHPGVVNSNANVTRWEGDVTACEEVTITIEFTGGNGIGDWTAKRNDIELTDPTPEQTCD